MLTKKDVLAQNKQYRKLINAVISNIGEDSIQDVNNYGINGGFSGFIYYSETSAFYRKHRKLINQMAFEMASEMGENVVEMIGGFNCVKSYDHQTKRWNKDNDWQMEIGKCIYDGKLSDQTTQIENALAWFAAEEVCRMFDRD